ncbi:MAG TPA: adenylate cyclase regulatory domain-containing protein [Mycobacterium sp.]|uniref:adenylate/guanylate cyclase domain-containing protein n=1 Tax=Mycobacterium sp. TaxID=1785 RepID=UPI002C1833C5|nr:adenylate cyclase regulatory domain-containing protein [Mycobacterium sp.]HME74661.1 adenylate cyclase regulatory domain-containing protein [Mycobacterium sp.]
MTADFDAENSDLLDGLEGRAHTDRAELIVWLLDRGFSIEQIRASTSPLLLPAQRVMGDDGVYLSAREACTAMGLDLGLLLRLQNADGLPRIDDADAAVLPRVDALAVGHAKFFLDLGADEDETVAIMRVLMQGLERAAAVMRRAAYKTFARPGASEIELAMQSEEKARQAVPGIGPVVNDLMLVQLRHIFVTEAVTAAERAAGSLPGAREIAVAFADLAGFTSLGAELPAVELEHIASILTGLAEKVAVAPVQFVKSIGDAVMFVSPETVPLLNAVLDLVGLVHKAGLPPLRVGVDYGDAVSSAGDWFGNPVNVASRLTHVARPGTVLVAAAARETVPDTGSFGWSSAYSQKLKGISDELTFFRIDSRREDPSVARCSAPVDASGPKFQ